MFITVDEQATRGAYVGLYRAVYLALRWTPDFSKLVDFIFFCLLGAGNFELHIN